MKNKEVREELISIYGKQCFLNGVIIPKNPLTLHHLGHRKPTNIDNGSLLCRLEHTMFHFIEDHNRNLGQWLEDGFIEYKQTKNNLLILQMRLFVDSEIKRLGCEVEERKDILVLKRK